MVARHHRCDHHVRSGRRRRVVHRRLHGQGLQGRACLAQPSAPSRRAPHVQGHRRRRGARAGLDRLPRLDPRGDGGERRLHLPDPAVPGSSPAQPREPSWCACSARLQHRGELRHEHQLAELHRRDDDELLLADRRARAAQLPQRRHGHGDRDRRHPRDRPAHDEHARQLLGRHRARHALRPAADQRRRRARARRQRRHPEPQRLLDRPHAHQRDTDDRAGPGRITGGDQGPRDQRWRILQRQQRAPVREPQRIHERASRSSRCCSSRSAW